MVILERLVSLEVPNCRSRCAWQKQQNQGLTFKAGDQLSRTLFVLGSLLVGAQRRADNVTAMSDDDNNSGPDVGLVVLLLIALVTGACAAYTLLTATGVLGG